ncbi:hypothetical protein [Natronobacterium texcoconense]|uniref:RCK C-terminal domain-containing protein n=1 Tax=Natronobacterium texcoconense TaxID=1095778 RepID=A0A1H0YUR0_NATTX|nr:hypothetical protein [Natronobacterium texcoconense]SDQ18977.1 hypothetical protein SAMN04489842_0016 [Natronobacterium texcoconense]
MFELTTAVIVAVAFGLVLGVGPAITVGVLTGGFAVLDRAVPRSGAAVVALVLAGLNGYAVGVTDAATFSSDATVASLSVLVGGLVVAGLALYAHSLAETVADDLPFDVARPVRRERGLSAEAIDAVDGAGWIVVRSTGSVRDVDGYPPLGPELRAMLEEDTWRLPADLPLSALESRLEARLRTTYDLATVSASIDERGRATIAAAPPSNEIANRIPEGWRTVTVWALLPTGLAPGDVVSVSPETAADTVTGRVIDIDRTDELDRGGSIDDPIEIGTVSDRVVRPSTAETPGGEGRITVAVPTTDAGTLLERDRARIVATSGTPNADRAAFAVLERAGQSVRSVSVGRLQAVIESADLAVTHEDVRVLAGWIDGEDDGWIETSESIRPQLVVEPDLSTLEADDEVFVAGDSVSLRRIVDDQADVEPTESETARSPTTTERRAVEAS